MKKNHMILSIDVKKKHLTKSNTYSWLKQNKTKQKTPSKIGIKRNFLNLIKNIYKKHTTNITLSSKKPEAFPLRSETR